MVHFVTMRTRRARTVSFLISLVLDNTKSIDAGCEQVAKLDIANTTAPSSAISPPTLFVVFAATRVTWPGTALTDREAPIGVTTLVTAAADPTGLSAVEMLSTGKWRYVSAVTPTVSTIANRKETDCPPATHARTFWRCAVG